jgi:hypothetical protein
MVSWLVNETQFPTHFAVKTPINNSCLIMDEFQQATVLFGLTLQVSQVDCRAMDRWMLSFTHDYVIVARDNARCQLHLSGEAILRYIADRTALTRGCGSKFVGGKWCDYNCDEWRATICECTFTNWFANKTYVNLYDFQPLEPTLSRIDLRYMKFNPQNQLYFEMHNGLNSSGDLLTPTSNPAGLTITFDSASCVLRLAGEQPISVYKDAFMNIRFTTVSRHPTQRTFAWALWCWPDVRNLIVNTQMRSVYSILDMPQTRTWLEADEECRQLGHEFRMLEIGNVGEFDATVPYVNQDIPLYQKRRKRIRRVRPPRRRQDDVVLLEHCAAQRRPRHPAAEHCAYLSNQVRPSYPCDVRKFCRIICESKTASYYPWTHSR